MTVDILFSGSRGNCTLIRDGDTAILVDCGKSARAVTTALKELGCDSASVAAIFITHEHSDHTSALESFLKRHPVPLHMTRSSAENCRAPEALADHLVVHETEYSVTVGSLKVTSFPLPHDSACHVGYVIESADDAVGIATDMGHVTEEAYENLSRCRRCIIESNHDLEMLHEGPYPAFLKRRIASARGHLSNTDCAEFVCRLADAGVRAFALAHLSPENNIPNLAYSESRSALDSSGHQDCELVVADREFTVRLPEGNKIYAEN